MPIRVFTDGEILDASEVNTYFMKQAILVFDTVAARTSAFSAITEPGYPSEGMFSYIKDDETIYIYTGTGWTAQVATVLDGSVTEAKIANSAVTTNKINNAAVTSGKIANSVTLTTPNIGVATATSVNGLTITSSTGTLTITNGKTLNTTNSLTLSGTDSSVISVSGNVTIGSSTHTVSFVTTGNTSVTLPASGTLATIAGTETLTNKTLTNPILSNPSLTTPNIGAATGTSLTLTGGSAIARQTSNNDAIAIQGRSGGSGAYTLTLSPSTLTASRTISFPDNTGVVVTTGDSGTVTSSMIENGTIVNADINSGADIAVSKLASGTAGQVLLANSSGVPTYTTISGDATISSSGVLTLAANSILLGTDTTGNYVESLVAGTNITLSNNSGESATPTIGLTYNALTIGSTSIALGSTALTLSGLTSVSATTFTGALTGNASSATQLQTARNINGQSFNGTADITVTAAAGTLTGTTLNSGVVTSSLTSVGSLSALTVAGATNVQQIREKVSDSSISANIMTCDYTTGSIFYQNTNPVANFTADITNIPTDNGNAITVSIFVNQGASNAFIPSQLKINSGSAETIKWAGGFAPSGTLSKIDLFTFVLIRRSGSWTVLGSANLNY